jgi:hypothetical protein
VWCGISVGVEAFVIKRNDSYPSLEASLTDENGAPVNVTGAQVQFVFSEAVAVDGDRAIGCATHAPGETIFSKAGVIQDGAGGVVRYDWINGDTAAVGRFFGEFKVTFPGSRVRSFPTLGYIPIRIVPDLS